MGTHTEREKDRDREGERENLATVTAADTETFMAGGVVVACVVKISQRPGLAWPCITRGPGAEAGAEAGAGLAPGDVQIQMLCVGEAAHKKVSAKPTHAFCVSFSFLLLLLLLLLLVCLPSISI